LRTKTRQQGKDSQTTSESKAFPTIVAKLDRWWSNIRPPHPREGARWWCSRCVWPDALQATKSLQTTEYLQKDCQMSCQRRISTLPSHQANGQSQNLHDGRPTRC
jgi:hypothetical protein